jgi:hypothetical protein
MNPIDSNTALDITASKPSNFFPLAVAKKGYPEDGFKGFPRWLATNLVFLKSNLTLKARRPQDRTFDASNNSHESRQTLSIGNIKCLSFAECHILYVFASMPHIRTHGGGKRHHESKGSIVGENGKPVFPKL